MKNKLKIYIQNILKKAGYNITKSDYRFKNDFHKYYQFYPKESIDKKKFYNLCAGGHFGFGGRFNHPFWTNIDIKKENNCKDFRADIDIDHDFFTKKKLPIENNSAELVHSRFTIEHLTNDAVEFMFKEVFRILKNNGFFKIVVPNFSLDYKAYLNKDISYFSWRDDFSNSQLMEYMKYSNKLNQTSIQQTFLVHFASNASLIHSDGADQRIDDTEFDQIFNRNSYEEAMDICTSRCSLEKQIQYRQNHINWWDPNKLSKFLTSAGFTKINQLSPGQSNSPVMRNPFYFDNMWNNVALIMEAEK